MDLPAYVADLVGNRTIIGIIAVVHVWINHAFAVGMIPLVTAMEWWAHRRNRPDWDELAYRILFVCFLVTTTVGALTGVGIWLSTAVINPYAIGSLLRVFYWAWFTEWLVFVSEVVLLLVYTLTWKGMGGERKPAHIRLGIALSAMSWLTMAVIVAVLGFMMNPGPWLEERNFLAGVRNPLYFPQLLFRTSIALAMAGSLALALASRYAARGSELRTEAVRAFSGWTLFWLAPALVGGVVYYQAIPQGMLANMPVAFGTQAWENHFGKLLQATFAALSLAALVALWGILRPRRGRAVLWVVPLCLLVALMAYFERAREFIRKPYVIGYYMYANGIRVADVPYLLKTGILTQSAWASQTPITEENRIQAGGEVFTLACTRCHTLDGVSSVRVNLERLYPGRASWDPGTLDSFLKNMHGARPYMPPFIGTAEERLALATFLSSLKGPVSPRTSRPDSTTTGN